MYYDVTNNEIRDFFPTIYLAEDLTTAMRYPLLNYERKGKHGQHHVYIRIAEDGTLPMRAALHCYARSKRRIFRKSNQILFLPEDVWIESVLLHSADWRHQFDTFHINRGVLNMNTPFTAVAALEQFMRHADVGPRTHARWLIPGLVNYLQRHPDYVQEASFVVSERHEGQEAAPSMPTRFMRLMLGPSPNVASDDDMATMIYNKLFHVRLAEKVNSSIAGRSCTVLLEVPFQVIKNAGTVSYTHLTLPTTPYV
mgnify:CR=1 FL=1